jgi:hypothetical protein
MIRVNDLMKKKREKIVNLKNNLGLFHSANGLVLSNSRAQNAAAGIFRLGYQLLLVGVRGEALPQPQGLVSPG